MEKNTDRITLSYSKGNFEWKTERDNTAPIITLQGVNLGSDVDAMLINQAKCPASSFESKIIDVSGTKSSTSDSAVNTLKGKGYSVYVNGIQL